MAISQSWWKQAHGLGESDGPHKSLRAASVSRSRLRLQLVEIIKIVNWNTVPAWHYIMRLIVNSALSGFGKFSLIFKIAAAFFYQYESLPI